MLRTVDDPPGLAIVLPGAARLTFAAPPLTEIVVSSDAFVFQSAAGETMGCLLDAHHLLVCGAVGVSALDDRLRSQAEGDRLLLGAADHFDPSLIDADMGAAWTDRCRWVLDQPILSGTAAPPPVLFRALSVMKGQVSPAGRPPSVIAGDHARPLAAQGYVAVGFGIPRHRLASPRTSNWRGEMIDAVFDGQREDGFIPHQLSPTYGASGPYAAHRCSHMASSSSMR